MTYGDAGGDGEGDDAAPGDVAGVEVGREVGVHEETRQVGVLEVRRLDAVQERGANDAPPTNRKKKKKKNPHTHTDAHTTK